LLQRQLQNGQRIEEARQLENGERRTEIRSVITAQRAYEMNSKVITAADEMLQATNKMS
jgi:flagellar basal-body rod protein FlgG